MISSQFEPFQFVGKSFSFSFTAFQFSATCERLNNLCLFSWPCRSNHFQALPATMPRSSNTAPEGLPIRVPRVPFSCTVCGGEYEIPYKSPQIGFILTVCEHNGNHPAWWAIAPKAADGVRPPAEWVVRECRRFTRTSGND